MQPQYRNLPAGAARSPHTARRGPGPMVPTPQAIQSQQQWHEMQQKSREHAELAKRRSEKPVDRNIPEGVEDIVLGDGVEQYDSLREVERKLDAAMMRKRLDIQDSAQSNTRQYGTMRIWISNTADSQPWQASGMSHDAFDFTSHIEASFRVKIEGRLLDVEDNEDVAVSADGSKTEVNEDDKKEDGEPAAKRTKLSPTPGGRRKLSHFFKSINIDFDRAQSLQPDGYTAIKWERPDGSAPMTSFTDLPNEADFDCLEFERKSDENINVTISLIRDEQPERYKLSRPLAELLDFEEADRKTVLMGLWEYVKANALQEESENRRVRCDARLRNVFGRDSFFFPELPNIMAPLMFDPQPVSLQYTIRVDKEYHSSNPSPTVYDIPVPLADPLQARLRALTSSPSHTTTLRQISALDDRLAMKIQEIAHAKAKHAFFTGMSKDPVNFTKRWISSQKRDLDVVMGAGAYGDEDWQGAEWRKGGPTGPWGTDEAVEGIGSFLSRHDKARQQMQGAA